MSTPLTARFSLEDFIVSDYTVRHGFDNWPSPGALGNIARLAEKMENVCEVLGYPVVIVRSYMSALACIGYGSSKHSSHALGLAADFRCHEFGKPKEIAAEIILAGLPFDQLIVEGPSVHFGISPEGQGDRRQILTAHYRGGESRYTTGLES